MGSITGLGRCPGEGNGNPLQHSSLGNPTDRGAWQATVYRMARVGHNLASKPPPPVSLPGKFHGQEKPGGLQSMGSQRAGHD